MGLFNFGKKKEIEENEIEKPLVKQETQKNTNSGCKKYNLLCINFGVNDYSFTLTVNSNGKIIINKSMSREEYEDYDKTDEIAIFIEENLNKIKEATNKVDNANHKNNNMLQFEINGEKYTLFRNDIEDETSMFYDRFVFEIANILDLKKSYENIELDFTFEYPNNWDQVPTDLNKYCLLSSSTPILVFKDSSQNFVTFEYINLRSDIVTKIINNIRDSEDYEVLKTIDYETKDYIANFLVVDYNDNDKIELFCFLNLKNICVIITTVIDDKANVDIDKVESSKKFKEIFAVIDSVKILTNEDINK